MRRFLSVGGGRFLVLFSFVLVVLAITPRASKMLDKSFLSFLNCSKLHRLILASFRKNKKGRKKSRREGSQREEGREEDYPHSKRKYTHRSSQCPMHLNIPASPNIRKVFHFFFLRGVGDSV